MINLVIEPFMWEEKLITPCDNTWIHIGLRTLDYEFLTIEKLEKTIKDETNRIFKG